MKILQFYQKIGLQSRLKSKYQNSQLACGDIFESLKKILTNYADQKKTLCTSKLHELFIALLQELDQPSKDIIKSYQANADLLEELCTKVHISGKKSIRVVHPFEANEVLC